MKHIPNLITIARILISPVLLFTEPFGRGFFAVYLFCGVSDMLDGYLARKMGTGSDLGAILDSIADFVFMAAVLICVFPELIIPSWLVFLAITVTLIRIGAYVAGFLKYRTYSSLHTYLNKLTGLLLFLSPLLYHMMGIGVTGAVIGTAGVLSAVEELIITLWSQELNRDVKSIREVLKKAAERRYDE